MAATVKIPEHNTPRGVWCRASGCDGKTGVCHLCKPVIDGLTDRLFTRIGHGFVTWEEHARVLDLNRSVDRANGERAQEQLAAERADFAGKLAQAAHGLAEAIRSRCNDRTVPSEYRRQGVLQAADWLDGAWPW
jgi:hypothetical protein